MPAEYILCCDAKLKLFVISLANIEILPWLTILEDAHQFLLLSWLQVKSTQHLGLLQGASLGTGFFLHLVTGNDGTFHWMEFQSEN